MSAPSLLLAADVEPCCDDEEWKPIPDWPHESSTCGRVRSVDRLGDDGIWRLGAMLPPQVDKRPGKGYLYYDLRDGKRRRKIPAAVAVLEAHRGLRPPGREACHNHGIRDDNHLAELRWDTREANIADMLEHALQRAVTKAAAGLSQEGRNCHRSQVRGGARASAALSQLSVTGDSQHGTRRLRLPLPFVPVFTSVKTGIRAFRDRKAV